MTSAAHKRRSWAALGLAVFVLASVRSETASAHPPDKALVRKLATPASVRWRDVPLRPALERLSKVTKTPLWIDRRVDPQREVTLVATEQPLAELLDQIASQSELGMAAIDRLVYIGPRETAAILIRWSDNSQTAASKRMKQRGVSSWDRLATPQQISAEIAKDAGVAIENPERIPHDLWPAGETPAMAASDRLTLLLAGFDLRWRPLKSDARRVRIEPIEAESAAQPLPPLASLIRAERDPPFGESRYTLRIIKKPLGAVLRQLATQLGRDLDIAPSLGEMTELISVSVDQATLQELLAAVGEAGEVSVTAEERIVVRPLR